MHGMAYENCRRPLAVGQIQFAPQKKASRMKLDFLLHNSNHVMILERLWMLWWTFKNSVQRKAEPGRCAELQSRPVLSPWQVALLSTLAFVPPPSENDPFHKSPA